MIEIAALRTDSRPINKIDHFFCVGCWLIGGSISSASTLILFSVLARPDDPVLTKVIDDAFRQLVFFACIYLVSTAILTVVFYMLRTRIWRNAVLSIGGFAALTYLYFVIPLTGGIHYSPLSFSFIFLPAVVGWYANLENFSDQKYEYSNLLSTIAFCILCASLYSYFLFNSGDAGSMPIRNWMMSESETAPYITLETAILVAELAIGLGFSVIGHDSPK